MTWSVASIPADRVAGVWPLVAPLLAPAVDRSGGRIDLMTTFDWLEEARLLLWTASTDYDGTRRIRAAFTTRIAHYPLKSMVVIECCGGSDMHLWVSTANEVFRGYAQKAGCAGVEIYGRAGWSRALRKFGWSQTMVLCEIDAAHGDGA